MQYIKRLSLCLSCLYLHTRTQTRTRTRTHALVRTLSHRRRQPSIVGMKMNHNKTFWWRWEIEIINDSVLFPSHVAPSAQLVNLRHARVLSLSLSLSPYLSLSLSLSLALSLPRSPLPLYPIRTYIEGTCALTRDTAFFVFAEAYLKLTLW
jgi:hypothetical protein